MTTLKITSNAAQMTAELNKIKCFTEKKSLLFTEAFLIESKDGEVTATAVTLHPDKGTAKATALLTATSIGDGEFITEAKAFLTLLKSLGKNDFTLDYHEVMEEVTDAKTGETKMDDITGLPVMVKRGNLSVNSGTANIKLDGAPSDGFPSNITQEGETQALKISSNAIKQAFTSVDHCVSKEKIRPAITGVLANFKKDGVTFSATDGHRLSEYKDTRFKHAQECSILFPIAIVKYIKAQLPKSSKYDFNLHFNVGKEYVTLEINGVTLIFSPILGDYPNFENVIEKEFVTDVTVNKEAILSAVVRVSTAISKSTHPNIRFNFKKESGTVTLDAFDGANQVDATETVPCEVQGEDIKISFNHEAFVPFVKSLRTDSPVLNIKNSNKMIVSKDFIGSTSMVAVCMPVLSSK